MTPANAQGQALFIQLKPGEINRIWYDESFMIHSLKCDFLEFRKRLADPWSDFSVCRYNHFYTYISAYASLLFIQSI